MIYILHDLNAVSPFLEILDNISRPDPIPQVPEVRFSRLRREIKAEIAQRKLACGNQGSAPKTHVES